MWNTRLAIVLAIACAAGSAPAPADEAPQPSARYSFSKVDDGFLRLDNQTGQVAHCGPASVGWACQAVAEDRAALEKEIARLQDEVAALKQEVATLRAPPAPPRPPADLSPPDNRDDAIKLREDMARARVALKNAWNSLVDMIMAFQKDMMRKG